MAEALSRTVAEPALLTVRVAATFAVPRLAPPAPELTVSVLAWIRPALSVIPPCPVEISETAPLVAEVVMLLPIVIEPWVELLAVKVTVVAVRAPVKAMAEDAPSTALSVKAKVEPLDAPRLMSLLPVT